MTDDDTKARLARLRREPPPFRVVEVVRVERRSPRLIRLTLAGPALSGMEIDEPAASVRLLLPSEGDLVIPTWNGNEFLLDDGSRPIIRTFTPRRFDAEANELIIDAVIHGDGPASAWANAATAGTPAAVSGPGRGYNIDLDAKRYLLVGDETAIPAIDQLLESIPAQIDVVAHIEISHREAEVALATHPRATVTWHERGSDEPVGSHMVEAVRAETIDDGTRVWVAGEAAAVQQIRNHLFKERSLARRSATVRGYWKQGRGGDASDD
ncbi:MAG: siderophore-interacting protein [Acidimicrobiales bacterium]